MKKFQMALKLGGALVMAIASLFAPLAGPSVRGKVKNSLTAAPAAEVAIVGYFGRKKKGCKGVGICKIRPGATTIEDREVLAQLSTNAEGKLTLVFSSKPPEEGTTLYIDEDIIAQPAIASGLGFKSVTLLKGEYAYNSGRCVIDARLVK